MQKIIIIILTLVTSVLVGGYIFLNRVPSYDSHPQLGQVVRLKVNESVTLAGTKLEFSFQGFHKRGMGYEKNPVYYWKLGDEEVENYYLRSCLEDYSDIPEARKYGFDVIRTDDNSYVDVKFYRLPEYEYKEGGSNYYEERGDKCSELQFS